MRGVHGEIDGEAVRSCLMLAVQADGHEVGDGGGTGRRMAALHPIQEAFSGEHGLQCGFCTPGFLMMAGRELLGREPGPRRGDPGGISGNLCRCTGYQNIVDSIRAAADELQTQKGAS